jgi:predicted secreted hydrolase
MRAWKIATALLALLAARTVYTGPICDGTPSLQGSGGRVQETWNSVTQPRPFLFPADHAAHPDYRIEWWYYTGNLQSSSGRRFGFQVTFFRTGVVREPLNPSRWAIRDLFMGHFALSDIQGSRLHAFERLNRGGLGQAGAERDHYHVWNGDWQVRLEGQRHLLQAREGDCGVNLELAPLKPPILHGDHGMSRKGPSEGNASYYYSLTRMRTTGTVVLGGETFTVTGLSWMDHEFSTSFLEKGQRGWDWFALQLDDGRELMIYQIRRTDGTADPFSSGTLVDRLGNAEHLSRDDFTLVPGKTWKSGTSGATYPVDWTVRAPRYQLELHVEAALAAQELNLASGSGVAYWEGAIRITGQSAGRPVAGCGYLEMTGYARHALGPIGE